MKKKIYLFLIMAIAALFLSACSDREPIDRADFISAMEAESFEIQDVSYQIEFANYVTLAIAPDDAFQIEFYEFDTDADARSSFDAARQQIESGSGRSSSHTSVNVANYNRFTMTSSGRYAHIYRVGHTMLFVYWADSEHRSEIRDLLGDFEN